MGEVRIRYLNILFPYVILGVFLIFFTIVLPGAHLVGAARHLLIPGPPSLASDGGGPRDK